MSGREERSHRKLNKCTSTSWVVSRLSRSEIFNHRGKHRPVRFVDLLRRKSQNKQRFATSRLVIVHRAIMSDASKPEKILSTDNETMESTTNSCEYLTDDKALRKKMKKEKQKEKKNPGRPKSETIPKVDVTNKSNKIIKKIVRDESGEFVDGDDKETNNTSTIEDDDDCTDVNYSTMLSAFVQSIVSKNYTVKALKKNDSSKGKESFKDANHKRNKLFTDDADGFTCVKKGGKATSVNFNKTPEGFGNEALRVIRECNYELAINYLTRAIALDQSDARHYINRSYCYLRVGNFSAALADIKFASKNFTDITEISQAKCREGQAYCGLQNYEEAERAFCDSANLAPDYQYVHREKKRMQVLQMVHMGFNERDALLALQKHPTTMEAINVLAERAPTNNADDDSAGYGSEDEDEIFFSDSEDNPSNERLLSKIVNYDPNIPEEPKFHELPPSNDTVNKYTQPPRAPSADRALRIIKAVVVPTKPKTKPNQSINDKAVWVGSLNIAPVTDQMLQKRFAKFGKVIGVWRAPNDNYAFVNFQCATGPQKAFEEARYNGGIDLNGTKLPIKEATVKTFK